MVLTSNEARCTNDEYLFGHFTGTASVCPSRLDSLYFGFVPPLPVFMEAQ